MTAEAERLVSENLPLVYACVKRFTGRGETPEDLAQAGFLGLIRAAAGFDPALGCRFSTYAVPAILGEMRGLFREGGAVHVTRKDKDRARLLRSKADALASSLGRAPTVSELAEAAGISAAECALLWGVFTPPLSLSVSEDDPDAPARVAPVPGPEEAAVRRADLERALGRLSPEDRALLRLRYREDRTQTETAAALGMTQVQVSRREKKLLARLREELGDG